jgi:putative transposase
MLLDQHGWHYRHPQAWIPCPSGLRSPGGTSCAQDSGDTKFVTGFDAVFTSIGVPILLSPPRAPSELLRRALVGTARRGCTDRLLIHNQRHVQHALDQYVHHYNEHWPHRSLEQRSPVPATRVAFSQDGGGVLHRKRVLGGLINEYSYEPAA